MSVMNQSAPVNTADVKETMKRFIDERFLMGGGFKNISDDDSFLENGIIDSTGTGTGKLYRRDFRYLYRR
jgi:hypothetical protein